MRRSYHYEGSRDEAKRRLETAMELQAERYPRWEPTYRWVEPYRVRARFRIPVLDIEQVATMMVWPDRVDVHLPLPRLLNTFRDRISAVLDKHARIILDGMLRDSA